MTKHRNEVYQDKHGTWWARVNGQRETGNTRRHADQLYKDMLADDQRDAIMRRDPDSIQINGMEIIALRGAPGSGKTTWADAYMVEHPEYKRISKDCLRQMFDGGEYSAHNEKFIRHIRCMLIRECMEQGRSVIVDDTNLGRWDLRDIKQEAHVWFRPRGYLEMVHVPVRIVDMVATLDECIARDAQRVKPVGAERVRELYAKWEAERPAPDD